MKRTCNKILYTFLFFTVCTSFLFSQEKFSQENAVNILYHLTVEIGPRPMGSPAERAALQYAAGKFKEYGCDTSYVMEMTRSSRANTKSGVAVGIKWGETPRQFVIGGHVDSYGPEVPGVDDDGSGAACVIELSRMYGKQKMKPTLVFCCFGGEEQGTEGSYFFVDNYKDIDKVELMLQLDMANGLGVMDLDAETHGSNAPKWLIEASAEEYYNLGYDKLRYPTHFFSLNYSLPFGGAGSDHEPFLEKGIPAIDFSTDVDNPIHTPLDSWANYDQRGLQRSGNLVQRLIERFNNGIPKEQPQNYWVYQIKHRFFFIPVVWLWSVVLLSILFSVIAYFKLYFRKVGFEEEQRKSLKQVRYRLSALKLFGLTMLVSAFAWLLPDVLILITEKRFPWFAAPMPYLALPVIATFIAIWGILQFTAKFKLQVSSLPYFRMAAITLLLLIGISSNVSPRIAIYPAGALLIISLAMLIRQPAIKFVLVLLGSFWLMRPVVPEWFELIARSVAETSEQINVSSSIALYNTGFILFFTVILTPFLFSLAAAYRDAPEMKEIVRLFRSKTAGVVLLLLFMAGLSIITMNPTYNKLFQRRITIDQNFDIQSHDQMFDLRSNEYLKGLNIKYSNFDTTITKRAINCILPVREPLKDSWVTIERTKEVHTSNDTTSYKLQLKISCTRQPYVIDVFLEGGEHGLCNVESPMKYNSLRKKVQFNFYAFPDSVITIPVSFQTTGKDSVTESDQVYFNDLFTPMSFTESEKTYFIKRSKFVDEVVYKP